MLLGAKKTEPARYFIGRPHLIFIVLAPLQSWINSYCKFQTDFKNAIRIKIPIQTRHVTRSMRSDVNSYRVFVESPYNAGLVP